MSNIIDTVENYVDKAKNYVEEHPWQSAALLAAWPVVGVAAAAGVAAHEAAKVLPSVTITDQTKAEIAGACIGGAAVTILGGGIAAGIIAEGAVIGALAGGLASKLQKHEAPPDTTHSNPKAEQPPSTLPATRPATRPS